MTAHASRAELLALLRLGAGSTDARIDRALRVLVEDVGMDVAYLSRFEHGQRTITHAATAPDVAVPLPVGLVHPEEQSLCHLVATGALPALVPDAAADPVMSGHPQTAAFGLGAQAAVPLVQAGAVVGALCCVSLRPAPLLDERDTETLHSVAGYLAELQAERTAEADLDAQETGLQDIAGVLAAAGDDVEALTRPLLHLLHRVTGLESTYLTVVDWAGNEQRIVFSLNTGKLTIPEDLAVAWDDTLCRRSLEEDRRYTSDVPAVWGDSEAARALGIITYVSVPVRDADSGVIGTLCGASSSSTAVQAPDLAVMDLFAGLIGGQLVREGSRAAIKARADELEEMTAHLRHLSERDALTGLLNRAGIHGWLSSVLASLRPDVEQLAVAFIDLDSFKPVNDTFGHAAGDQVLNAVARAIDGTGRGGDLRGRLGGDEFIVAAVLPATGAALGAWTSRLRRAVGRVSAGVVETTTSIGVTTVTTAGVSAEQVLRAADEAMYEEKARKRVAAEDFSHR